MGFAKNDVEKILSELDGGVKMVALVAPSFIVDFGYPSLLNRLSGLGFDKAVELTFGAKMINREYHKKLKNSKELVIASPCPGIVQTILNKYPQYKKNLILVDSPLVATAKICRKYYPEHKFVFISPCDFKKMEVEACKYIDYVIDYDQLRALFVKRHVKAKCSKGCLLFDKFYNDYTKIYPLSGGLGKTAHLKGVIKEEEVLVVDGIKNVMKFLNKPDPKIRFLDVLFYEGGCIGGPHVSKKLSLEKRRKKVFKYLEKSRDEDIPEDRKGLIDKAKGLKFGGKVWFDK